MHDDEPLFIDDELQEALIEERADETPNIDIQDLGHENDKELFINSPSELADPVLENRSTVPNDDANNSRSEEPEMPEPQVSDQPVVDKVKLASILKDFNSAEDPLFRDVPNFVAEIVKEMLENDFLLVLGRGLGLSQILTIFLAKVRQIAANALVLVLGHRSEDDVYGHGDGDNEQPIDSSNAKSDDNDNVNSFNDPLNSSYEPQTIGFGVSSAKRSKLYKAGGIYHITGPIAVVDMLTGVLDPSKISGMVIAHGERVSENSTIAFVVRLLKERNPSAFIKALSDNPERLVMPPSLPLKLRVLGVPTIMLWPRFHMIVDRTLPKLVVDEVIVEQSVAVRRQQALLSELMQAVISDIKRRVPHLDVDFLAPELGAQHSPDKLHASMSVDTLLSSNDFPFRVRNALQGVWHQLSKDGRNSVHSLGTLQQLQHTLITFDARTFYVQLEFACRDTSQPWTDLPVVPMLLSEARRSAALRRMPGKFYHIRSLLKGFAENSTVIILCDSLKTVHDLHNYLNRSEEDNLEDEQALRELEERMQRHDEEEQRAKEAEHAASVNSGRPGRRRVRGGGNVGKTATVKREQSDTNPPDSVDSEPIPADKASSSRVSTPISPQTPVSDSNSSEIGTKRVYEEIDLTFDEPDVEISNEISSPFNTLTVILSTYRGDRALHKLKPSHIIMYDPNLAFTREVERYVASQIKAEGQSDAEVHFMYYQQSVEELQYLTSMRREKDAFTRLIREKGLMPMHIQDGEATGGSSAETPSLLLSSSRRKYQINQVKPLVVVDIREFRSALPFHIWQARMDVVPLTLLVGDYVLTPDIVVERKSISDLIGSFRDGRLYQQCEAMLKYYNIACLLIEFDNKSHFTMEPFKDIRTRSADVQREIQENLSTLILRFPKLRIIWSSSPLHSAQIFQELKNLEAEPVPSECAKAGESMMMESAALSMLEAMPGVTPRTSPWIARKVSNIEDLVNISRDDLWKTLGQEDGEKLWRFLNNKKADSVPSENEIN